MEKVVFNDLEVTYDGEEHSIIATNLPDGVTCMCNYSYQHDDADFIVGEQVMLIVQRYDTEKRQMYGKIMSKR